MYKDRETIEKEFDKKFIGYNIFDDSFTRIIMDYVNEIKLYIHQIRQDDLEEVKKIIKEKGLHLGYKNDILDKLDNLNR